MKDADQGSAGELIGEGLRIAIVRARFNDAITSRLAQACLAELERLEVDAADIRHVSVPGALEVPLALKALADSGEWDALIALGCVIRGDTAHFDFVAGEAARGIADAARDTGKPVIFGVLTTENVEQAVERASPARMDKGGEAMEAALEMALVLADIDSP